MNRLAHAEADRRVGNVVRVGTVEAADYAAGRIRVRVGEIVTGWIPWADHRAGGNRTWSAPEVGEQMILLAPSGEIDQTVAIGAIHSTAAPGPGDNADVMVIAFSDGARLAYDRAAHALTADLPGGGTVAVTAPGGVTITGDVTISGTVTVSEDVIASGVSLVHHTHGGVDPGPGSTGEPN